MLNLSCSEPTLEQLLEDPLTQAVMRADRINPHAVRRMLASVSLDLESRAPSNQELSWQAAAFERGNVAQWLRTPSCLGC